MEHAEAAMQTSDKVTPTSQACKTEGQKGKNFHAGLYEWGVPVPALPDRAQLPRHSIASLVSFLPVAEASSRGSGSNPSLVRLGWNSDLGPPGGEPESRRTPGSGYWKKAEPRLGHGNPASPGVGTVQGGGDQGRRGSGTDHGRHLMAWRRRQWQEETPPVCRGKGGGARWPGERRTVALRVVRSRMQHTQRSCRQRPLEEMPLMLWPKVPAPLGVLPLPPLSTAAPVLFPPQNGEGSGHGEPPPLADPFPSARLFGPATASFPTAHHPFPQIQTERKSRQDRGDSQTWRLATDTHAHPAQGSHRVRAHQPLSRSF